MDFTFLEASVPLTKTITQTAEGLEKSPYPSVLNVTSHAESAHTIDGMYDALIDHATLGHCLLKGNTVRDLVKESRAGNTVATTPTEWICLDIDGLPHRTKIDSLLTSLGIADTSYILQYSASHGLGTSDLRCHIFVWLADPIAPPLLKQWLLAKNLELPVLRSALSLTSTHLALRYGLDITTCQNDKLLYIAPPRFVGMKDPFAKKPRITLVKGKHARFNLDASTILAATTNRLASINVINALRSSQGLDARKFDIKKSSGFDVLVKPDDAVATGIKTDRGFTYFNLNGGDSWGYYHPERNPDYIHNFKGEPSYLTKELLPAYWEQVSTTKATKEAAPIDPAPIRGDIQYLAFCDPVSSAYYRGTYNKTTNTLDLTEAKNTTQIKDFLKQHGLPIGDFVPEWRRVYEPLNPVRVDTTKQIVNLFEPSKYMQATPIARSAPPPTILRVIHHALGENEEITRHFINWLAYIVQKRDRTLTAWLLFGTTGTGKGIITYRILKPLLGDSNIVVTGQQGIEEKYNAFLERSLVVCVDEMEHTALDNSRSVMAKLKSHITEEKISIRDMRKTQYEAPNRTNWIFSSNRTNPLAIDREDRRINVARYQDKPQKPTQEEFATIESELQHFHDYLALVDIDITAVRTPIATSDRNEQIANNESSVDTVIQEIKEGNFDFFIEQLPTNAAFTSLNSGDYRIDAYVGTLQDLIRRTDRGTGVCNIAREELRIILAYVSGIKTDSPNKFTSMMKHHKTIIQNIWLADQQKTVKGIPVTWKDTENFERHLEHFRPVTRQPLKVVK